MDKEELRKKLDDSTRAIQEKAANLYEAHKVVEAYKKRKRVFATPPAADEAEEDLPLFKEVLSWYTTKTKEEIIESGTLKERLLLYFVGADLNTYFHADTNLSNKESKQLLTCMKESSEWGQEKETKIRKCVKEYQAAMAYSSHLRSFYLRSQACFAILSNLINRLDTYERTAEKLTILFQTTEGQDVGTLLDLWGKDFEGAELLFEEENQFFFVDANEPTSGTKYGLYKEIADAADDTASTLSDFKAYAKAGKELIEGSILKYEPISIHMALKNAEEERYPRFMVKDSTYFRSQLNKRIADGGAITPAENLKAVIPDFYEVPVPEDMYQNCKALIDHLMS